MVRPRIKWDRESCIAAIQKFTDQKKRTPKYEEFHAKNDLPNLPTLLRYLQVNRFDDAMEIAIGKQTMDRALEEFVWTKSCQGSKPLFYLNSRQVSEQTGLSIRKVGAGFRKYNKPGKLVAGYQLESMSHGEGTRKTFKATLVEPPPNG